jgi:hypothetical protein
MSAIQKVDEVIHFPGQKLWLWDFTASGGLPYAFSSRE